MAVRFSVMAVSGGLLAAAFFLAHAPAEAYNPSGCKFSGSNPTIDYRFYGLPSIYQSAFNSGQSAWDSTAAPGYFNYAPNDPSPNIEVRSTWSTSTNVAWTGGSCGSNGVWNGNKVGITFNERFLDDDSTTERKLTAIHELGHAYGLNHETKSCNMKAVMYKNSRWVWNNCGDPYAPYADDISGVIWVY